MSRTFTLAILLLAAAAIGCSKTGQPPAKKPAGTQPAQPAQSEAAKKAELALQEIEGLIKAGRPDEADTQLKALEAEKDTLPAQLQERIDAARQNIDAAKKSAAATQAAAANQQAEGELAKVNGLIGDGKLDEADAALKPLEARKASLSKELQDKITAARDTLDAAKSAKAAAAEKAAAAKQAQADLANVQALIKAGKLDEADAALKKLQAQKASLPEDVQKQIDAAAASLEAARKAKAAATAPATKPASESPASILERILALIKDGKLGDAETLLKPLESQMGSLPQGMQDKIKAARAALTAKKAAAGAGVKLPGM